MDESVTMDANTAIDAYLGRIAIIAKNGGFAYSEEYKRWSYVNSYLTVQINSDQMDIWDKSPTIPLTLSSYGVAVTPVGVISMSQSNKNLYSYVVNTVRTTPYTAFVEK